MKEKSLTSCESITLFKWHETHTYLQFPDPNLNPRLQYWLTRHHLQKPVFRRSRRWTEIKGVETEGSLFILFWRSVITCLNLWYERSANSLKDLSVLLMSKWLKSLKNCVITRILLMSPYKGCFIYYYWRFSNNGQDRFHLFFIVISEHSWHSVSLDFILESLTWSHK